MGRRQGFVYHAKREEFPRDFPERLDRFRLAAGLSWRELARRLKVNARLVRRWRAGAKPGSGHLVNLFDLAAGMGLLHLLLPSVGEPEANQDCGGRHGRGVTGNGTGDRSQSTKGEPRD